MIQNKESNPTSPKNSHPTVNPGGRNRKDWDLCLPFGDAARMATSRAITPAAWDHEDVHKKKLGDYMKSWVG